MELVPWRALGGELGSFRREMDRLWNHVLGEKPFAGNFAEEWAPSVDISETKDNFIVKAELPGLDVDDVNVSISGDITADTDMKVEGLIEGRILQGAQLVEIGERGRVIANIHAREVKIGGEVSGDIRGEEKVMITRTGRVQGNIVAPRVQLEDGSLFRGSIEMNPAQPVESKPAATKTRAPDASAKTAKTAPSQVSSAAPGNVRKEPGLTLKSG